MDELKKILAEQLPLKMSEGQATFNAWFETLGIQHDIAVELYPLLRMAFDAGRASVEPPAELSQGDEEFNIRVGQAMQGTQIPADAQVQLTGTGNQFVEAMETGWFDSVLRCRVAPQ